MNQGHNSYNTACGSAPLASAENFSELLQLTNYIARITIDKNLGQISALRQDSCNIMLRSNLTDA